MVPKKQSLWPGFGFILVGCWLLSRELFSFTPMWHSIYPFLMLIFGILFLIPAIRDKKSGSLFWGVFLLCIGAFFVCRNLEIIPHFYPDEYWPIYLLSAGAGFLALFISNPKDYGTLIPAGFLLFFGIRFAMSTFHGVFWGWRHFFDTYWPVLFILVGLGIALSGSKTHRNE